MAVAPTPCAIADLTAANPCLNCLSVHQLKALYAYLVSNYSTATTVSEAIDTTNCWCTSKKDLLKFMVSALMDVSQANTAWADLIEAAKCFECATPHQLDTIIAAKLCLALRSYFATPAL